MLLRPSARSPRRPGLRYEWKPSVAATPVSLRHRGPRPLYVRLVQGMDEMALICSDKARYSFVLLCCHAQAVPSWDVVSLPLPHAHPRIYAETTFQSGNEPQDDGANQWLSTPNCDVYDDPSAVRGAITRGQP